MKKKAPVSYADWHDLYHQHAKALGFVAHTYFDMKLTNCPGVMIDPVIRSVVRRVLRLSRIEKQLDEAAERNDVTYREHSAWVDELLRGNNNKEE